MVRANKEHQERLLTRMQEAVVTQLLTGATNKEIGFALDLSEATVKWHLCHIYERLGVHNRTALVHQLHSTGASGGRWSIR